MKQVNSAGPQTHGLARCETQRAFRLEACRKRAYVLVYILPPLRTDLNHPAPLIVRWA